MSCLSKPTFGIPILAHNKSQLIKLFLFISVFLLPLLFSSCRGDNTEEPLFYVSFNSNGGTPVDTLFMKTGLVNQPNPPTKSGYSFAGWYTSNDFSTLFSFSTQIIGSSTTLYAKWDSILSLRVDVNDRGKEIIGAREFFLEATVNGLGPDESIELVFIASESKTPLSWADVQNKPAKLTRLFKKTKNIRELYFSLTDKLLADRDMTGVQIKFNGGLSTWKSQAEAVRPGIMWPNTTYYVHAYVKSSGGYLTTSKPITTEDFSASKLVEPLQPEDNNPAIDPLNPGLRDSFGPYMWGVYELREPNSLKPIEVTREDIIIIPIRMTSLLSFHPNRLTDQLCYYGRVWEYRRYNVGKTGFKSVCEFTYDQYNTWERSSFGECAMEYKTLSAFPPNPNINETEYFDAGYILRPRDPNQYPIGTLQFRIIFPCDPKSSSRLPHDEPSSSIIVIVDN